MHYVYLTNNTVTDQAQIDPINVFSKNYAEQFIEAPDEVTFEWSLVNGEWVAPVVPVITPEQIQAQNKQRASTLLLETDWVELPSVSDINNIPYLLNKAEFIDYRIALRVIVVNPSEVDIEFPSIPSAIWINE